MQKFARYIYKTQSFSIFLLLLAFAHFCYAIDQGPENFINQLYKEVRSINLSKIASEMQKMKIEELMAKNIDFDSVAKFVLGQNLKNINKEQLLEFQSAYKKSASKKYSDFLSGQNQDLRILGTDSLSKNRYLVNTEIKSESARDYIKISYLVIMHGRDYKIIDAIIADSISVASIDKEEINVFLEKNTISDLINALKN